MDRPRETLLAGSGLAQQDDGQRARRRAPDLVERRPQRRTASQAGRQQIEDRLGLRLVNRDFQHDADPIAQAQNPSRGKGRLAHLLAVHEHAVGAAQIADGVQHPVSPDFGVLARSLSARQLDLAVLVATKQQPLGLQQRKLPARGGKHPADGQHGRSDPRSSGLLRRDRRLSCPRGHGLRLNGEGAR